MKKMKKKSRCSFELFREKFVNTKIATILWSGIANAVSSAALRFGHGFVVPELHRADKTYNSLSPIKLRDAFFAPESYIQLNDVDSLLRGAVSNPVKVGETSVG